MSLMVAIGAALPTAVLSFLSSSVPLYLNNQEELHRQSGVLAPFLIAFGMTWIVGAVVLHLSSRTVFRFLSWVYLLFGPFLLLYRFLPIGTLLVVVFTAVVVLVQRRDPRPIFGPMAIFGVVLIGNEIVTFATRVESAPALAQWAIETGDVNEDLPNVYHVVLDALQTDVLELLPAEELDSALRGTAFLPNHAAVYHSTVMSLGSMFTSSRYAYDRPRGDYVITSFGEASYLSTLRDAGYRSIAVAPVSDPLGDDLFDDVRHHGENFERGLATSSDAFVHLWIVANIPRPLLDRLLSGAWLEEQTRRELRLTMTGRGLTDSAPVASYLSFRNLMEREESLPARGRYTFIHLLIPHSPYVLKADCSYQIGERASEPTAQTVCTLQVLGEFFERLDTLGRFDDALILVHGDHGAPFRRRKDELVPSRARSLRTPLFVKPPGRARREPLVTCPTDATLLDLAPTLLDFVGVEAEASYEGASLVPSLRSCFEHVRADSRERGES